jgi:hypothetical protein
VSTVREKLYVLNVVENLSVVTKKKGQDVRIVMAVVCVNIIKENLNVLIVKEVLLAFIVNKNLYV